MTSNRLREFRNGKLKVARDGWLPKDRYTNIDITGNICVKLPTLRYFIRSRTSGIGCGCTVVTAQPIIYVTL